MFFLFRSRWEQLVIHSKQLEYYFSEKNKRDFKFGYFIPWRGCLRQPNSPSTISHEIFSDSDRLLFKSSIFLVKIFIYFKQQIHEINSFKKLEWLILKFCRKLGFISRIIVGNPRLIPIRSFLSIEERIGINSGLPTMIKHIHFGIFAENVSFFFSLF